MANPFDVFDANPFDAFDQIDAVPVDPMMEVDALGSVVARAIADTPSPTMPIEAAVPSMVSPNMEAPAGAVGLGYRAAMGEGVLPFTPDMELPVAPPTVGVPVAGNIPPEILAKQAEYEKKTLMEVTGERLRSGGHALGSGVSNVKAANTVEELEILDAADKLDATDTATLQDYADLANRASKFSLEVLANPVERKRARENLTGQLDVALKSGAESTAAQQKIPRSPIADAFFAELSENGFSPLAVEMFTSDPTGIMGQVSVENVPNAIATVMAVPLLGPAGGGMVGYGIERGASIGSYLQSSGVDTADPEAVRAAMTDPALREEMETFAVKRGVPIALFDALSLGLAKLVAGKPVKELASQLVVEPATEGVGEAAAGLASTGKIDIGEVAAETLGGTGSAVVQAAAASGPGMVKSAFKGKAPAPGLDAGPTPGAPTEDQPPHVTPEEAVGTTAGPPQPQPPDVGVAPAKPEGAAPATPTERVVDPKRRSTVYTPDNEAIDVETMVVEAETLLTSDQEGYPAELQPRDRTRAASQTQIDRIANNPIGARLDNAPETDRGSPILASDGSIVESGNGRVMALRKAYEQGTAEEYRAYVEQNYPEAVGMKNPVIVRRRITDVNQQQFTSASNTPATLQMSATENAKSDAALIDRNVIGLYRGGGLSNVGNREMIRAFIAKLPQSVQGALVTPQGGLSVEGQRRFQNALFHKAYGDDRLLNRLAESTDDDMKSITNALADAAGRVAQLRDAIERGEVSPDVDVTGELSRALERIVAIKAQGTDLKGFKSQTDAFAEPMGEIEQALLEAFYNSEETRTVSKSAIEDFLSDYVDLAMEQKIDQGNLAGVEAVPLKSGKEVVDETRAKQLAKREEKASASKGLFDKAEPGGAGANQGRNQEQRADDGGSWKEPAKQDLKDEAPTETKKTRPQPKGTLAPTFLDFSFTDRNSVYEAAFREAGLEPDKARLLSVDEQISKLRQVLLSRFGVRVELPQMLINRKTITGRKVKVERNKISSRDAIDQMLDAYRQMEMLAHLFGVPHAAIGLKDALGNPIALSLTNKVKGALGMYSRDDSGNRTIHLPGRSNSFAHEWGHALDHWLGMYVFDDSTKDLLSRDVLKDGLTAGQTRSDKVAESFIGLLQAIFGDKAKLAAMQIDLAQQATETFKNGNPSHKAKAAQKLLADIAAGKKMPKEVWSKYFQTSLEYDKVWGTEYFQDPAEMLARAMETFAGVKASAMSDLPTSFLSKPSWAYTGSEDQRASMTFPRGTDADVIFAAFERLGDALRETEIFGTKTAALKPEDADVFDIRHWDKWVAKGSVWERHKAAWQKKKHDVQKLERGLSTVQKIADTAGYFASTFKGYLRGIVARQPKPAQKVLTNLLDMFTTEVGSGRAFGMPWEGAVEATSRRYTNRFDAISRNYNLDRLSDSKMKELRQLLTVPKSTTNDKSLQSAAADLRRLLDDVWRYLDAAGVKVGYVKNGWLPRIMDIDVIQANKKKFLSQAQKVYRVMFDNDVRQADLEDQISDVRRLTSNLGKAIRADDQGATFRVNLFTEDQIETIKAWRKALSKVSAAQKALDKADDGDKEAAAMAKLAEATEAFMEIHEEVLDVVEGVFATEAARAWATRIEIGGPMDFDTKGPDTKFLKTRTMPAETDEIMADFFAGDALSLIQQYLHSVPRRAEWVRRAGVNGEKIENMLTRAEELGASGRDMREIRRSINMLTGRSNDPNHAQSSWVGGWTYVAATALLLKRAFFSSWAEPLSAGIRTGNTQDSFSAMAAFVGQVAHTKDAKDRFVLARTIGLITSAYHESIMVNRYGGDIDPSKKQGKVLSNFFQRTMLTGLTNWQRAAMLKVSHAMIARSLAKAVNGSKWHKDQLADIGVPEEHFADMKAWLDDLGGLPKPEDMLAVDGSYYNDAADIYANASVRLIEEIIQNPKKYDRPGAALDRKFAVMYGITGFTYALHANLLVPLFKKNIEARADGESSGAFYGRMAYGSAKNIGQIAPAVGALFVGQLLVTVLREAIFNRDTWDKKEEDDELAEWLMKRAFSRTGIMGPWEIPYQLYSGVMYSRDLANGRAGPHFAVLLANLEAMLGVFGRNNSPNTNTAEYNAIKAAANMLVVGGNNLLMSSIPGGPLQPLMGLEMFAVDAMDPGNRIAELLVGEKGTKHKGHVPWWELGD